MTLSKKLFNSVKIVRSSFNSYFLCMLNIKIELEREFYVLQFLFLHIFRKKCVFLELALKECETPIKDYVLTTPKLVSLFF